MKIKIARLVVKVKEPRLIVGCFRTQWLTNVGSPGSEIHHCELTNWEGIVRPQYKGFVIRF